MLGEKAGTRVITACEPWSSLFETSKSRNKLSSD